MWEAQSVNFNALAWNQAESMIVGWEKRERECLTYDIVNNVFNSGD